MAPDSRPDDLVGRLSEQFTLTFRRVRAGVAAELRPLGLTFAQARMLRMIARTKPAPRIGDLATRLEIAPRSATGMVDTLERAGLVTRVPAPDDRRSVLVELTEAGHALVDDMARARRAGAEEAFGRLTRGQQEQLLALLHALDAPPADAPGEVG